jgi:hypothetical protein
MCSAAMAAGGAAVLGFAYFTIILSLPWYSNEFSAFEGLQAFFQFPFFAYLSPTMYYMKYHLGGGNAIPKKNAGSPTL